VESSLSVRPVNIDELNQILAFKVFMGNLKYLWVIWSKGTPILTTFNTLHFLPHGVKHTTVYCNILGSLKVIIRTVNGNPGTRGCATTQAIKLCTSTRGRIVYIPAGTLHS